MIVSLLTVIAIGLSFLLTVPDAYAQQTNATIASTAQQQPQPLQQQQVPVSNNNNNDDSTTAILGGTAAAAAGGIITALTKQNKDKKKIDNVLRDIDHDKKEEGDAWTLLLERAAREENKDVTFFQLLSQPVYPGNSLNRITLGANIIEKKRKYDDWFEKRYIENPK